MLSTTAWPPLQWYRDGVPIPGANSRMLTVTEPGRYEVLAWQDARCTVQSAPYLVTQLSSGALVFPRSYRMEAYPSPTRGDLSVRLEADRPARMQLRLVNVLGQVLRSESADHRGGSYVLEMDLRGLPAGVYMLSCETPDEVLTQKLLLQ